MERLFPNSPVLRGDVYIADYTNTPQKRGVVISALEPSDIPCFRLLNPSSVPVRGVNIEMYPSFKKDIENCEALCVPCTPPDDRRCWALFVELKYCNSKKIDDYGPKAINQMDGVRMKLIEMRKIDNSFTCHFNYCSPTHADAEPFDGFKETQHGALDRVESQGVIFHARMELVALDASVIVERKLPV